MKKDRRGQRGFEELRKHILWPSQNIWTLKDCILYLDIYMVFDRSNIWLSKFNVLKFCFSFILYVFSSLRYGSPTYWRSWIQSTQGQNEQHPANYFRVARIKLWLFGQRCRMSEIFTVSFCWRIEFSTHHWIYRLDKPWMSL